MALLPNNGRILPNGALPVRKGTNFNLLSYKATSVRKFSPVALNKSYIGSIVGKLGIPVNSSAGFYWK